jgi:hypothetical protein
MIMAALTRTHEASPIPASCETCAEQNDRLEPALRLSPACSRSDISGWPAGVLYLLAGGGRESGATHLDLQTDPRHLVEPPLFR